jgi:hypothetical protein
MEDVSGPRWSQHDNMCDDRLAYDQRIRSMRDEEFPMLKGTAITYHVRDAIDDCQASPISIMAGLLYPTDQC